MGKKTTSNLIKQASWGKSEQNIEVKNPPKPKRLWPPKEHLSAPGRHFWRSVGRVLLKHDLLNDLSRPTFENAATLYDRICRMNDHIREHGEIIDDGRKSLKRNPAIMIQQAALTEFRALCTELGLNPYSMNKLGVNLKITKDETAEFLFGEDK